MAGKRIRPGMLMYGAMVPHWLLQRTEISPGAKLLHGTLADQIDPVEELDFEELSKRMGASEKRIKFFLEELIQFDLIKVQTSKNGTHKYELFEHEWMEADPVGFDGPSDPYPDPNDVGRAR